MPAPLIGIHHIALICSDYIRAKHFYTQVLGARILAEHYRADRHSHKLDLCLPDGKQLELFSFPNPPPRRSHPEACGLRPLAVAVADLEAMIAHLQQHGVVCEPVRRDEYTGHRFTFCADPDGLPLEFYEVFDVADDGRQSIATAPI